MGKWDKEYWDGQTEEGLKYWLASGDPAQRAGALTEGRKRRAAAIASEEGIPEYLQDMVWDSDDFTNYTEIGSEEAKALGVYRVGAAIAGADPVAQKLEPMAMDALDGLDPETYTRLQNQAAEDQRAVAANLAQGRTQSYGAIQSLGNMPSVVDQQAAIEQERARRAIASQLASQRGGFSPAAQRAAMMATGNATAGIGADAVVARAAEERAARMAQVDAWNKFAANDRANAAVGADSLQQQGLYAQAADNSAGGLLNAYGTREGTAFNRYADIQKTILGDSAIRRAEPTAFEKGVDIAAKTTAAAASVMP